MTTTEQKIKEAFEAWHKNNFDGLEGPIKLVIEQTFLAGYMECLNVLDHAGERKNDDDSWELLYRLPEGVTKP